VPHEETSSGEPGRRRGIYLLPNLLTTAALFAGFFAIISAMGGDYRTAAVAIFVAMILDGLDGRVARLTNTQTEFGVQFDSLADLISFGLAPALVVHQWALTELDKVGWLAAFVYVASAALRLARFNTQVAHADRGHFQGLASPAAAALLAGMVWAVPAYGLDPAELAIPAAVLTVLAGLFMVSNLRYRSFKDFDLRGRVPFVALLVIVLIFVLVALDPPQVLFGAALIYAASGPVETLRSLRHRRRERARRSGS
jgi:CDP-diacylglycerol--serine O-phosphatidyltransferase